MAFLGGLFKKGKSKVQESPKTSVPESKPQPQQPDQDPKASMPVLINNVQPTVPINFEVPNVVIEIPTNLSSVPKSFSPRPKVRKAPEILPFNGKSYESSGSAKVPVKPLEYTESKKEPKEANPESKKVLETQSSPVKKDEPAPESNAMKETVVAMVADKESQSRFQPYQYEIMEMSKDPVTLTPEFIKEKCTDIINYESPITETCLFRTYCRMIGVKRITDKKREQIIPVMRKVFKPENKGIFVTYWAEGADRDVKGYRVVEGRSLCEVPLIEVQNAIVSVAETLEPFMLEVFDTHVARCFGKYSLNSEESDYAKKALKILIDNGKVVKIDHQIGPILKVNTNNN